MPTDVHDKCSNFVVGYNASAALSTVRRFGRFFWVHIPKCGSTFEVTLYLWACPAPAVLSNSVIRADMESNHSSFVSETVAHIKKCFSRQPRQGPLWCDAADHRDRPHQPLDARNLGAAMVLLRDPRQRFVSAFRNELHCYGLHDRDRWENAVNAALKPGGEQGQQRAVELFSLWEPGLGCQTKMMTGEACCETPRKHMGWEERLAKAIKRLSNKQEVAFVGITDLYAPSVCLFHAMHGGKLWDLELKNIHKTSTNLQKFALEMLQPSPPTPQTGGAPDWDVRGYNFSDSYDQRLFDAALQLFNKRLLKYSDLVGSCCEVHGCKGYVEQVALAAFAKTPATTMPVRLAASKPSHQTTSVRNSNALPPGSNTSQPATSPSLARAAFVTRLPG